MVRKIKLLLTCLLLIYINGSAQIYKCSSGKITFFSEAPVENINAVTTSVNSFIKSADSSIAFIIPVSTFTFEKSLMQEHFNEKYMETEKYPNSIFAGKITGSFSLIENGEYALSVTGKLNIHGVENKVTEPGSIKVNKGIIHVESKFTVALKDYNIEIPKLLFQNIAENILITITADYTRLEK